MNAGERAHLDAWKAAVTAATTRPAYEYDDDEMPTDPPPLYTLVAAVRRFGPAAARGTGEHAVTGWRLVTRFVGTTNREALWLLERFAAAHEDQQLTALDTSPLALETPADPPEVNDATKRRETEVLWSYTT